MSASNENYLRSTELMSREASRLLVVDVQEKLLPTIAGSEKLVAKCRRLVEGAKLLGVPVFVTEQYPKGLGPTAAAIAELVPDRPAKVRFSCAEVLQWGPAAEQSDNRHQVVVCGMETHVCVLQTCLDLVTLGYQVFVVADAVASRNEYDREIALDRMASAGVTLCTMESVLFEWCSVAGSAEFKTMSGWLKNS